MNRIWIYNNHFITVDDEGFLVGPYYEGALGVVIPLFGVEENERYALKIPRMLADTIRENAYIAKVTDDEATVVHKVPFKEEGGIGLMATKLQRDPLRLRRALEDAPHPEARAQHKYAIFLSFVKGRPPRFCSCGKQNDEEKAPLMIIPSGIGRDGAGLEENWDAIVAASTGPEDMRRFSQAVCYIANPETETHVHALSEAIVAKSSGPIWYAGIPAIVYEWGNVTIQQAISDGILEDWSLYDCFELFTSILTGLHTLHSAMMIHGDIRPANIMAVGDRTRPGRYRLIDYGSFSRDSVGPGGHLTGNTMVGAGIGQQRVTPFYSRERRAGVERESADTAVILRLSPDGKGARSKGVEYLIRIGWRTKLIGSTDQKPREEVINEMRSLVQKQDSVSKEKKLIEETARLDPERLYAGDRLRVQDYLFEIVDSTRDPHALTCRCRGRYAKVFHDHLIVYNADGEIPDGTVLSLPRYTEYLQWTAATDLYGFGAVVLYCLFMSAPELQTERVGEQSQTRNIETRFSEMMNILDNVSYFNAFWPELQEFRARLEKYYDDNEATNGAGAAEQELDTKETDEEGKALNLRGLGIRAAQNVVKSAPHAKRLLRRCENNVGKFLLVIHFALSCFHRRSDITEETRKKINSWNTEEPFCKSRLDLPDPKVSLGALNRLNRIETLLAQNAMLSAFVCTDKEVPDFNPQSDPVIRLNNERLERKLKAIRAQCVVWQRVLGDAGFRKVREVAARIVGQELPELLNLTPQGIEERQENTE